MGGFALKFVIQFMISKAKITHHFECPLTAGCQWCLQMVSISSYQIYAVSEYEDRLLVTTLSHVTTLTFLSLPHLNCLGKVNFFQFSFLFHISTV